MTFRKKNGLIKYYDPTGSYLYGVFYFNLPEKTWKESTQIALD